MEISAAQCAMLQNHARLDFERRALAYLRDRYPGYTLEVGELRLRRLLTHSELQALVLEIGSELGIVAWAELLIVYGLQFAEREPWAEYIMTADLEPNEKIDRLRQYL